MKYDPLKHHRRSIRLKKYDYSEAGAYFVTVCTQWRLPLWGEIVFDDAVGAFLEPTLAGEMVAQAWMETKIRFPGVSLDEWCLMPNHLHALVVLPENFEFEFFDIVHDFKSWTTTLYCRGVHAGKFEPFEKRVWHRNYFERVVRDERELQCARDYIRNNPGKWLEDKLNPANPLKKRKS